MGSALGALKTAAKRWGLTLGEYLQRIASGKKPCTTCRKWLKRSRFCSSGNRGDGLAPACRTCHNEQRKAQYHKNVERSRAIGRVKDRRRKVAKSEYRKRYYRDMGR